MNLQKGCKVYHKNIQKIGVFIGVFIGIDKLDNDSAYVEFTDEYGFKEWCRVVLSMLEKLLEVGDEVYVKEDPSITGIVTIVEIIPYYAVRIKITKGSTPVTDYNGEQLVRINI